MRLPNFLSVRWQGLAKLMTACLLAFSVGITAFAQYKGAPVKKEKLIKALRSKLLQTEDIVTVINSNGVDFQLTDDVRKALISAGARPEVIKAVEKNQRKLPNGVTYALNENIIIPLPAPPKPANYDDLLEKAMNSYQDQKNNDNAIRYLQTAAKMKPNDAKAYQMLAFVNLYGLYNLEDARKYMKESILNGGSAVFRVFHDDNGDFVNRCSGSLYISPEKIRFESDDNIHTFETSTVNIQSVKNETESSKTWKKYPVFNVYLKFGKEKTKFRFAPITGKQEESNMAAYFITESQTNNFKSETNGFSGTVSKAKTDY